MTDPKSRKVGILNDHPIQNPQQAAFGFAQYNRELVKIIGEVETPITIGILGNWGTGKTSLMRMACNALDEEPYRNRNIPVWFNAWRFENELHLVIPLLYSIRDKVVIERKSQSELYQFGKFLDQFIRALGAGLSAEIPIGSLKIKYNPKDSIESARQMAKDTGIEDRSLYYDAFVYLGRMLEEIKPFRIVLFIDDLDRCLPEKMLQLLDSIKLMLDFRGMVTVVGLDHSVAEHAITIKYGADSAIDNSAFLRKLIQISFTLPAIRPEDIIEFILSFLREIFSFPCDAIARTIAAGAGANPREIKRLVNNFIMVYRLNAEKVLPERTALLLVLQSRWPTIYSAIAADKLRFLEFGKWFESVKPQQLDDLLSTGNSVASDFVKSFGLNKSIWNFLLESDINLEFSTVQELEEYLHLASIASYGAVKPGEIQFRHIVDKVQTPEEGNSNPAYQWRLFLVATKSVLDRIEQVTYELPKAQFDNPERICVDKDNNFAISEIGRINIPVHIKVCFKGGELVEFDHAVELKVGANKPN